MILKYNLYSIAGAAALLSTSSNNGRADAFAAAPSSTQITLLSTATRTKSTATRALGQDWDNGDFLSSLSGGKDQIEQANEKYRAFSQNREAMNEWRQRQMMQSSSSSSSSTPTSTYLTQPQSTSTQLQAMPNSQEGPSPEFLRKMGLSGQEDLAQLQQQRRVSPPPQQFQTPKPYEQPPNSYPTQQPFSEASAPSPQQQPPLQQFYDQYGNPLPPMQMPMVYDQYGNLVPYYPQQFSSQQQPQMQPTQVQLTPSYNEPLEPPLPPTTRPRQQDGPRPVGYNPDAYTMSNTADVYFAQLKRDSRVRKEAWLRGDKETASKVFEDEGVKKIRESWVDNPYTRE